ncbi:MAG: hypothetical protein KDB33_07520 [Acidimicrobiales bacterium]|nr:hypothetical protein [Acidimicrobiales bacterium]MCB1260221.1 hypothetical protein [Acidimicrobiales bacterium]
MELLFDSDGVRLAGHLALPRRGKGTAAPGLVIAHRFPAEREGAVMSGRSFPELADRIATELGWVVLVFNFRGCGTSEGAFSLGGWLADLRAATDFVRTVDDVSSVWLCGFGTGAALSICAGASDPGVAGVASVGAAADFDDWASHPRRLLEHAREVGILPKIPTGANYDRWVRELRSIRTVSCAEALAPRPLLVLHGSDDEVVPVFDARVLADAHGGADLRIVDGGRHALRHDPRAVAILLGWLDRQRNAAASSRFTHPANLH